MAGTYGSSQSVTDYLKEVNSTQFAVLTAAVSSEPSTGTVSYMNEISALQGVTDITAITTAMFKDATPEVKKTLGRNIPPQPAGVFNNIANKELKTDSVIFRVIVLYIRVKYLMNKLTTLAATDAEKKSLIEKLAINIYLIAANLDAYQKEVNALLSQQGGKKRKQKGGMDTAKIYNAQGLVQELSALNQNDTVSPAVLFPSPFSASSLTSSGSVTDTLPPDTVAALMPAIPIPQTGGKKKVKSAKKNKH